jgi:DNA-binding transcriptional regulator YdaS (Cro superfamily)
MRKEDAVAHFGSKSKLAVALGITPHAIYQWHDYIPKGRAYELQEITGGMLKYSPDPLKKAS